MESQVNDKRPQDVHGGGSGKEIKKERYSLKRTKKKEAKNEVKQEAKNFENEFKKMLADIAHDETIPF